MDFAEAALQIAAFAVVSDQRQRLPVALAGLVVGAHPAEEVGAGGVEQMVLVQVLFGGELVDNSQSFWGAVQHSERYGTIQGDDRGRLDGFEALIKGDDLSPVSVFRTSGLAMQSGDGGL